MAGLLGLVAGGLWFLAGRRDADAVPDPVLGRAIDQAAGYLARHCDKNGRFQYLVNLDPNLEGRDEYNIIRHAGAIYSLAMSQQRRPRDDVREAMLRATDYLRRQAVSPVPDQKDTLAVWSRPEIEGVGKADRAHLGGAGLGLVALCSVERLEPGTVPLETMEGLARFLVFMQQPDGTFYDDYDPGPRERSDLGVSLYYPGEAALGLVMLYERDPRPLWLETAAKAIGALAARRAGQTNVEPDHWALLATAKLLDHWDDMPRPPVAREAVLNHARQVCRSILLAVPTYPAKAIEHGCMTDDGRTCPTATRVEGLLAAWTFLPDDPPAKGERPLRTVIRATTGDATAFLIRSQVREGLRAGGIPKVIRPLPENHPRYRASSAAAMTEIRVDYVQHSLSAMIQFEAVLAQERATREPTPK